MGSVWKKQGKVFFIFLGLQALGIYIANLFFSQSALGEISLADRLIWGYSPFENGVFLMPIPLLSLMWLNRYSNLKDRTVRFKSRIQITKNKIKTEGALSFIFTLEYLLVSAVIGSFDASLINWQDTNSLFFSLKQFVFQGSFSQVLLYTILSYFFILFIALLLFDLVYIIFNHYFFSWIVILYIIVWDLFNKTKLSILFRRFHIDYSFYIGDENFWGRIAWAVVFAILLLFLKYVLGNKRDFM